MAYFDSNELVDCIRNAFEVEDNTGLSCKILQQPQRKLKPDGLPLKYGTCLDESDSDGESFSPNCVIDFDEDDLCIEDTSSFIHGRLMHFIVAAENQDVFNCAKQRVHYSAPSETLFTEKFLNDIPQNQQISSMVSRLIANKPVQASCGFEEYAKFEAMNSAPQSRTMSIVFPFCKPLACCIPITIFSTATLSDLIGLSCYIYTREKREPPCDNPSFYSLYLAEENLEYDTELPPQDRHRLVSECGFPILALVKNSELSQNQPYLINIYFVNGKKSTFELKSLDIPLQWLFDEALKQRKAESTNNNSTFREIEYVMETLEQKDFPLKLSNTISSTGCTDFVLLRKNSSRGEFFNAKFSKNLSPQSIQQMTFPNKRVRSGSLNSGNVFGDVLEEYFVDRLHKIKPKWPARFLIRNYGLEIVPTQQTEKRKSFVPQPTQKVSQIFWELIASVEVNSTSSTRRVIRIIYLFVPRNYYYLFTEHEINPMLNSNSWDLSTTDDCLVKAYELSTWKTLQIEAGSDEAWNIGLKLSEILDAKSSQVQLVYQHSAYATKRPSQAIEAALNITPTSKSSSPIPLITNRAFSVATINETSLAKNLNFREVGADSTNLTSSSQLDPNKQKSERKKISMVFSRMLSRQD